ncbi:MAG TPA: DUF2207 domain-containing protein [Longimicrobiales bacterium]|nr:DUF2207 domain-containing protein [Longimicrobiales bacterium]
MMNFPKALLPKPTRRSAKAVACSWSRGVYVATASLATLASVVSPARAQERSLDIQEMNARIVVTRSGDVSVTEQFVVRFNGSWNGIYRSIPVEYDGPGGLNYTLRLDVESVTDDAGTPLRYEEERAGGSKRIKMWVPGANNATRTIVLTYTADNAIRFFEEHDELYWNVTGAEWDFPIRNVTAEVLLPEELTGVRTTSFQGAQGSTESAIVEHTGSVVTVRGTEPLGFRKGLTLAVAWNPGVIERPTAGEKAAAIFLSNGVLLAPLLALLAMFAVWRHYGRDPDPGSVFVRYEPPPDMTPAEAGTLMDDSADLRDITATLVDLAVRGFVQIEETENEQLFGLISSRDYEIVLLRAEQWSQLKHHERSLLQALSAHAEADRVALSDLKNEFYKDLPDIKKHLTSSLVDGGFYMRSPTLVRGIWIGVAVLSAVGVFLIGSAIAVRMGTSPVAAFLAGGTTAIVVAVFGWLMPRRTAHGARMHTWLRGFEEFLGRVEKDRLERLVESPAVFEKFLPYAMAFGVEDNWANAFEGLATEPPTWYRTSDRRGFRPHLFVSDLGRMSTAAGSAMTSAPRSSSGSSGFSGGSSGGGFGGGGGGGF